MVRETSDDQELTAALEEKIRRRKIVKKLMAIRASKGLSQADIADQVGCSQSRISKFEASDDEDLRLGDLRHYLGALQLDLQVLIAPQKWTATDQIKFHAFQIRDCLGRLVDLAKHDKQIQKGVQQFHVEALYNLVKVIAESAQNLPKHSVGSPGFLDVEDESENGRNGHSGDVAGPVGSVS